MPKISFIVPVYKAEKTVRRCVESIVYGNEKDIEVILSEDCSPDNSREVCLQLQAEYPCVTYICNEKNSGVSHTRNRALDAATGEYIFFVDSDDWVCAEYAEQLLKMTIRHPEAMAICGFRFKEQVAGYEQDYLWDNSGSDESIVEKQDFFVLYEKVLLQELWNKVFRRDIIEKYRIRFDETQSMGEDFEFVLAYMEAAKREKCIVINRPLYAYIRATTTSLMSTFGQVETGDEQRRLKKLLKISGDSIDAHKYYEQSVIAQQRNAVYHIVRAKRLDKSRKLELIEAVMQDGLAKAYYRENMYVKTKESVVKYMTTVKKVWRRIGSRLQRFKNQKRITVAKKKVEGAPPVTILSQNCIGGVLAHDMGWPFLSPTVNLFFTAADFVKLANDPQRYLKAELTVQMGIDYPIGTLDDITVYFMHYDSCSDAREAWERRVARVDYDRLVILSTDMEGFDDAVFEEWKKVPYPKVLFTANSAFAKEQDSVYYPQYEGNGCVLDLIPKREFYKNGMLIKILNPLQQ